MHDFLSLPIREAFITFLKKVDDLKRKADSFDKIFTRNQEHFILKQYIKQ
jgi:hypothetical protein